MAETLVRAEEIPSPGSADSRGVMTWRCLRCETVSPILRRMCTICGDERPRSLEPWAKLAERYIQLTAPTSRPLGSAVAGSGAFVRFLRSMQLAFEKWNESAHYDLSAIDGMTSDEQLEVVKMMGSLELTWREVDVLACIDLPETRPLLESALTHHLSAANRALAAAALDRRGWLTGSLDDILAREICNLAKRDAISERLLMLVEARPSDAIKQALLFASACATTCAPDCAKLLCRMCGFADVAADPELAPLFEQLGLHVSSFQRQDGIRRLCKLVGRTID